MASLRLHKETVGWTSMELNNRAYSYWYTLKDKLHFLFECNLYNYKDLRANIYIPNYYTSKPNMANTIEMMMTNDQKVTRILNIFTYTIYTKDFG